MRKQKNLFYIHEIATVCDISINTLRFYETKELVKPAYTNPKSGYRYYSRENLHRLRTILSLKDAGLTLPEIKAYLNDDMDMETKTGKLEAQRKHLNRVIEDLYIRKVRSKDLTVHEINLPERLCLCRTITARDAEDVLTDINKFYEELILSNVVMSREWPEFCEYPDDELLKGKFALSNFIVTACVPIDKKSASPEAILYPSSDAVVINYRGDYYDLWEAYEALQKYILSHNYIPTGHAQEVYLEIDANGSIQINDPNYITRVIIPVMKST